MVATTAQYIGLRTSRYRPVTTSVPGGAMGAGVPKPSIAKRRKQSSNPIAPAASKSTPTARSAATPARGGPMCQRVSVHGTKTATVPGATTRKTAEPRTGPAFTATSYACAQGPTRLTVDAADRYADRVEAVTLAPGSPAATAAADGEESSDFSLVL